MIFKESFIKRSTMLAATGILAGASSWAAKPNVVVILMDDMAYGEANCFRPAAEQNTGFGLVKKSDGTTPISLTDSRILTPNLDKLAADGIRYTNFYSGGPVCGPARASLLQGMHTGNTACSVRNNNSGGFKMRAGDFTIANMLKNNGYQTGCVGKYGMNGNQHSKVVSGGVILETSKPILPHVMGFDYVYGVLDHVSGHSQFPGIDHVGDSAGETNKSAGARVWEVYAGSTAPAVGVNHELSEIVDTHVYECFKSGIGFSQDRFSEKAEAFIADAKANNKPFLLYVAPTIPHAGWFVPKAGTEFDNVDFSKGLETDQSTANGTGVGSFKWYIDQYTARQASESGWTKAGTSSNYGNQANAYAAYAAMISHVDRDLGKIRNYLAAQGLADNTIIIFSSDNGPSDEGGASVNSAFSTQLRGGKRSLYEGGIRMPTVVYAPSSIQAAGKAGTAESHIGAFCDIMPTLADLTGVDKATLPAAINGKSFAGTIDGVSTTEVADYKYWEDTNKQAVRWGKWKGIRTSANSVDGPVELYDLDADIAESANVAADNLEVVNQIKTYMNEARTASDTVNGIVPANITEPEVISSLKNRAVDVAASGAKVTSTYTGVSGGAARTISLWAKVPAETGKAILHYGTNSSGKMLNLVVDSGSGKFRVELSSCYILGPVINDDNWHRYVSECIEQLFY